MTPAARIKAAIEILQALNTTAVPADRFIRDWFRARRYAGSKDRAAVAERVFDVLRHRASYGWRMGDQSPRALVIAGLLAEGADMDAMFSGGGYGAEPLNDTERAAIAAPPDGEAPPEVRGEFPAFLEQELSRSLAGSLGREMTALQLRAPIDLRVNTLKAVRNDVLAKLELAGIEARATPYSPVGIRIDAQAGLAALGKSAIFERGLFEFQDEASQIAALLADAKPGERVLDLAAGAGGKSLAMAAAMRNEGEILAFDDIIERLNPLAGRAARAGASIIKIARQRDGSLWNSAKFDAVLLDAPCSGTGTWRRQPELRWRITPESLGRVQATQARLLADAARHVKPGGRIVYATCSLLASENDDQVAAFLAARPDFVLRPAIAVWQTVTHLPPPPGMGVFFRATPASTGTDGFFAAILVHDGAVCAD